MIIVKTFEELSTSELYEILRIRSEVFVVEQDCVYQDIDGKDQDAVHMYILGNDELSRDTTKGTKDIQSDTQSTIEAYLRLLKRGQTFDEASIGRVLVSENGRGKGHARLLMTKAIDYLHEEMGQDEIRISAQAYLEIFYQSLGFEKVSDTYLEDGIPHMEMLLQL